MKRRATTLLMAGVEGAAADADCEDLFVRTAEEDESGFELRHFCGGLRL